VPKHVWWQNPEISCYRHFAIADRMAGNERRYRRRQARQKSRRI